MGLLRTDDADVALKILNAFGAVIWQLNKEQVGHVARGGRCGVSQLLRLSMCALPHACMQIVLLKKTHQAVKSRKVQQALDNAESVFQAYKADGKADYQGEQRKMATIIPPPSGEKNFMEELQDVGKLVSELFNLLPPKLQAVVKRVGTDAASSAACLQALAPPFLIIVVQVYKGVLMSNHKPKGKAKRADQALHTDDDPDLLNEFVALIPLEGLVEVRV
jgi:hypothetical protein